MATATLAASAALPAASRTLPALVVVLLARHMASRWRTARARASDSKPTTAGDAFAASELSSFVTQDVFFSSESLPCAIAWSTRCWPANARPRRPSCELNATTSARSSGVVAELTATLRMAVLNFRVASHWFVALLAPQADLTASCHWLPGRPRP